MVVDPPLAPVHIGQRFVSALSTAGSSGTDSDPESLDLLPTRLAIACTKVLPVDAAGLSVISDQVRVPLGASDDTAVAAEQLQFTTGSGPCLDALHQDRVVTVTEADIAGRWPVFYDELLARSPYRSILSVPLKISNEISGALDLYFRSPTHNHSAELVNDATMVAQHIVEALRVTAELASAASDWPSVDLPAWMFTPTAKYRLRVWVAVGVLMAHFRLPANDALARLRAHAYTREQLLEQVAEAIIDGTLPVDDLRG